MKKEITKKQMFKGVCVWAVLIILAITTANVLIATTNPYNVPVKQLEQIQNEEGLK